MSTKRAAPTLGGQVFFKCSTQGPRYGPFEVVKALPDLSKYDISVHIRVFNDILYKTHAVFLYKYAKLRTRCTKAGRPAFAAPMAGSQQLTITCS